MTKSSAFIFLAFFTVLDGTVFSQAVPISSVPGLAATLVPTACTGKSNLLCGLPNLYGQYGLVLPHPGVAPQYNATFQSGLVAASGTQFTVPPLVNPASGFVYQYDPKTQLFTRTSQSLGPVMAERGETVGRHKLVLGGTYQRLRFQSLDGINLHNTPSVVGPTLSSVPAGDPYLAYQAIGFRTSADIKVNVYTAFGTFGLTNRIDLSVAIPYGQIGYNLNSVATINRVPGTEPILLPSATGTPTVSCCSNGGPGPLGPVYGNYFDPQNPASSTVHEFSNNGKTAPGDLYYNPSKNSAAGLGDITVRVKANVYHDDRVSVALLTDVRLPTGDAANFLGSGAIGVRPVAAMSIREGWLTPHINLGYQWNGTSILTGDPTIGTKGKVPGYVVMAAGTDIPFSKFVAFSVDYLGEEYVNAPRFAERTLNGPSGPFPSIVSTGNHVYNQSGAAAGIKISAFNRLLFTGNAIFSLTEAGLRQRITPMVGLSYVF